MRYALALLLTGLTASPASAQQTLFAADPNVQARLARQQAGVLSHLERLDAFVAADLGRVEPAALEDGAAVRVVLPGGAQVDLRPDRVEGRGAGGLAWSGRGAARGTLGTFVVHEGVVVGTVRHEGRLYTLRPLGGGLSALAELDEGAFLDHPDAWGAVGSAAAEQEARHRAHRRGLGGGTGGLVEMDMAPEPLSPPVITLIVPYTAAAAAAVGGASAVEALIRLAEAEANWSYRNSGVPASVEVVYTYQVAGSEAANDLLGDVGRLRADGDGKWDDVHALRDAHGADVAIMITGDAYGGYCGAAAAIYADASAAFAIAAQHCATGYYTFGHELGHLQGARHNPEADGATAPFAYGHGRYSVAGRWRTVMSYNCPGGCTRLPYWSNPGVVRGGIAMGDASRRHNARVLSTTAAEVASFRSPAGAVTVQATPTGASVVPGEGGPLPLDLTISNASGADFDGAYWVTATLPDGVVFGPVVGPAPLKLADGASVTESLTVSVPHGAPAGRYTLTAHVGPSYPEDSGSSAGFGFSKAAGRRVASAGRPAWTVENLTRGTSATVTPPVLRGITETLEAYPSPLGTRGTVAFTLAAAADVRVEVFDVTGRRLAVLVEGALGAGRHEAALHASALPSGVYLLRLTADGAQALTRRLTVVR